MSHSRCVTREWDENPRRAPRRHDTWIAATAMRHAVAVLTQDRDVETFASVEVIYV